MKHFILLALFALSCGSSNETKKNDPQRAETVVVETAPGEKPEEAPKVENEARTDKQKTFMDAQTLYDEKQFQPAADAFRFVVFHPTLDEMNYFSATLLMASLVELKDFEGLCREMTAIDGHLCRFGDKTPSEDAAAFCADITSAKTSCAPPAK